MIKLYTAIFILDSRLDTPYEGILGKAWEDRLFEILANGISYSWNVETIEFDKAMASEASALNIYIVSS